MYAGANMGHPSVAVTKRNSLEPMFCRGMEPGSVSIPYRRTPEEAVLQTRFVVKILLLLTVCGVLAGCRSRFIEVTIVNQGPTVHVMEFDYPSASFGANLLATGAKFHYRFKVQGPGLLSLQYEDASGHTRTAQGPKVELGDQGSLLVKIDEGGAVTWAPNLTNPK